MSGVLLCTCSLDSEMCQRSQAKALGQRSSLLLTVLCRELLCELLAVTTALLHPKEDRQLLWVCMSVLLDVLRGCCPTTGSKGQDFQK